MEPLLGDVEAELGHVKPDCEVVSVLLEIVHPDSMLDSDGGRLWRSVWFSFQRLE